jgi:lipoprotein-releasing system ATP-binding protein
MGRSQELKVLKGIDLEIEKGEIFAIVGHSGAGKSTLLHILGALDKPNNGKVFMESIDIFMLGDTQLARFRNISCGFVFQFHHLLPEFTALENIAMPGLVGRRNSIEVYKKAKQLLKEVDLEKRANHRPRELSGGEQQRVAFARSLINDPNLILADEPSGNLDLSNSKTLHELMWQLVKEKGKTFIIVTHNQELASKADRVIELYDGRIK